VNSSQSLSRRLFVALKLGEALGQTVAAAVRASLGIGEREGVPRHLRLYGARDLHVTLFFLGATAEAQIAPLEEALAAAARGLEGPELEIAAAGAFPDARRPRILWLGVREHGPARLARAQQAVHDAACSLGFHADPRPFTAHATVARVRPGRGRAPGIPPAFFALDPQLDWKPGAIELVESVRGGGAGGEDKAGGEGGGDAYRSVRSWPLPS
jgi:2'-5' RNA ligase